MTTFIGQSCSFFLFSAPKARDEYAFIGLLLPLLFDDCYNDRWFDHYVGYDHPM